MTIILMNKGRSEGGREIKREREKNFKNNPLKNFTFFYHGKNFNNMKKLGHCHHFVCILCCKRCYGGKEKDVFLILYCSFVRPLIHKTIKKRKERKIEKNNTIMSFEYFTWNMEKKERKENDLKRYALCYFILRQ